MSCTLYKKATEDELHSIYDFTPLWLRRTCKLLCLMFSVLFTLYFK